MPFSIVDVATKSYAPKNSTSEQLTSIWKCVCEMIEEAITAGRVAIRLLLFISTGSQNFRFWNLRTH